MFFVPHLLVPSKVLGLVLVRVDQTFTRALLNNVQESTSILSLTYPAPAQLRSISVMLFKYFRVSYFELKAAITRLARALYARRTEIR